MGFYGGINYGYGYFGRGFGGGRWEHDRFEYNRAVMNVNTTVIHNVYEDRTVIVHRTENRVSYNGGQGGIVMRPTSQEERVVHERHFPPARPQEQNRAMARSNPEFRASTNHGRPAVAATAHPAEFRGRAVVAATAAGAPYHPPANRAEKGRGNEPNGANAANQRHEQEQQKAAEQQRNKEQQQRTAQQRSEEQQKATRQRKLREQQRHRATAR